MGQSEPEDTKKQGLNNRQVKKNKAKINQRQETSKSKAQNQII